MCPNKQDPAKDPDQENYSEQGGPKLSLLWCKTPLSGQTLYLGGEVGSDGNVYCIPGHALRVLKIDVKTDEVTQIGPTFEGKFKWLRGVTAGNIIYGLPCHADSVLRIDTSTGEIGTISIPYDTFFEGNETEEKEQRDMMWKYHGGSTSPLDGCIYAIPQSAKYVMRIDPSTDSVSFLEKPLPGRYKYYGGVVGRDGAIYAIPHNSPSVLRIDPSADDVVTLHGDFGSGGHKWHGAAMAQNGIIVSVPANSDSVLCIRPGRPEPTLTEVGSGDVIQSGRHRSDRKYKFLGAMAGTDGKVYCFPCASERVLQVDTESMTVKNVGPNILDSDMEPIMQNKWQNGLTSISDNCVYAIPLAAKTMLTINTENSEDPLVRTWMLPSHCKGLAKWEGGVLAPNGVMYCVPNNFKAVLRVESPISTKTDAVDNPNGDGSQSPSTEKEVVSSQVNSEVETHDLVYVKGIPTLRSSSHRVKGSLKHRKYDPKLHSKDSTYLPPSIRREEVFSYDTSKYDLRGAITRLLSRLDPNIVGSFPTTPWELEDFVVPPRSLNLSTYGGQCTEAQQYLSEAIESDEEFIRLFDEFVTQFILPHLKSRLAAEGVISADKECWFFFQRPPTIRLQPGPAKPYVKPHKDADYGHQHGELNYWVPLTDRQKTKVDLWCETEEGLGDYHCLPAEFGQIYSFHGSSCRHYVPSNPTPNTRVSFDFRVGVEGFFDPTWQMNGTSHDHSRRHFKL